MDITLIIPAHKDRGYLDAAIRSALNQDFAGSYEIILASDGWAGMRKYAKKYGTKFSLIPKYNLSRNQNEAMKQAEGKYIKGLADDDLLEPCALRVLFETLEANPEYSLVFANAINFKKNTEILYKPRKKFVNLSMLLQGNCIHGGTTMFKRAAFLEVGGRDEKINHAEDYEFYCNLLAHGHRFIYVDEFVYRYRMHGDQKSFPASTPEREKVKRYIKRKYEKFAIRTGTH